MRDSAHPINEAEREEFEEMELEGGRAPTVTEVENREIFVIVILQQVSDDTKEVKQVNLQEALINLGVGAL